MTFEEWWKTWGGDCSPDNYDETKASYEAGYAKGHEQGVADTLSMFPNGVPKDMKYDI